MFHADEDELMEEVVRLLDRVDELLDRVRSGESVPPADIEALGREAVRLGFAKAPALFSPFAAVPPRNLN